MPLPIAPLRHRRQHHTEDIGSSPPTFPLGGVLLLPQTVVLGLGLPGLDVAGSSHTDAGLMEAAALRYAQSAAPKGGQEGNHFFGACPHWAS